MSTPLAALQGFEGAYLAPARSTLRYLEGVALSGAAGVESDVIPQVERVKREMTAEWQEVARRAQEVVDEHKREFFQREMRRVGKLLAVFTAEAHELQRTLLSRLWTGERGDDGQESGEQVEDVEADVVAKHGEAVAGSTGANASADQDEESEEEEALRQLRQLKTFRESMPGVFTAPRSVLENGPATARTSSSDNGASEESVGSDEGRCQRGSGHRRVRWGEATTVEYDGDATPRRSCGDDSEAGTGLDDDGGGYVNGVHVGVIGSMPDAEPAPVRRVYDPLTVKVSRAARMDLVNHGSGLTDREYYGMLCATKEEYEQTRKIRLFVPTRMCKRFKRRVCDSSRPYGSWQDADNSLCLHAAVEPGHIQFRRPRAAQTMLRKSISLAQWAQYGTQ